MALTLAQAETNARTNTRHDSDTRFSSTQWKVWAHDEYRRLRSWLRGQEVAPEFGLLTSTNQTLAEGGTLTLSAVSATLEGVHLVEWDVGDGDFRPMERASSVERNAHVTGRFTFREENGVLKFGPDDMFSGTVRVLYHNTPADLASGSDPFVLPVQCEVPLVMRTCGWIALRDGEGAPGKKAWDDAAAVLLDEALPTLRARHGIHPRRAGLQIVMGY